MSSVVVPFVVASGDQLAPGTVGWSVLQQQVEMQQQVPVVYPEMGVFHVTPEMAAEVPDVRIWRRDLKW